ncbi:PCC domain-containing protein [Galbitalea soli]|uniref:DNA-binding protein n=1 Tax=Galbitalea soli TaxID=1268042 RepID=A0A7C9TRR0_9MICO|nr:DNA-binding protein [Galbitalea soli]NYJ30197.1 putative DNA-binding protein with PD1-like motif [Galbitalea soli]
MAFGSEIARGRSILVVLEPGDDAIPALAAECARHGIAQGFIPVFSGAFRRVTVVGTDHAIDDEDAPLPEAVTVRNAEGFGSGTVATTDGELVIHLHVSVGEKARSAAATTGHLLTAEVQYPVEVVVEEIVAPELARRVNEASRGLATLTFPRG